MNRFIPVIVILITSGTLFAADRIDLGIFAGSSYYMGDINRSIPFYRPSASMGIVGKYNFNTHYLLSTNINYGKLTGNDSDFNSPLNIARDASFTTEFIDLSVKMEFSFKPFTVTMLSNTLTPFVAAGVGYAAKSMAGGGVSGSFNLPFGAGIKYAISSKISAGAEWILKKSFSDEIDGIKSFGHFGRSSLIHNNDWVSLAGFFITIKPFENRGSCPAYGN